MENTAIENLEKRVAALEEVLAKLLNGRTHPTEWKDWRQAVGKVTRTELAEEVDAAAREIREADRRQTRL